VGWTSYDKLEITFENGNPTTGEVPYTTSSTRDYENGFIVRLGGEYDWFEGFQVRGGFLYDRGPVKDERLDPTLPDANRVGINIGIGYDLTHNLTLDLAYLYLRSNERTITNSLESYTAGDARFNGVYNSTANLLGINLTYKI
jgi:long-chain fatty acid transport protein